MSKRSISKLRVSNPFPSGEGTAVKPQILSSMGNIGKPNIPGIIPKKVPKMKSSKKRL